jgi:hypothetical protein
VTTSSVGGRPERTLAPVSSINPIARPCSADRRRCAKYYTRSGSLRRIADRFCESLGDAQQVLGQNAVVAHSLWVADTAVLGVGTSRGHVRRVIKDDAAAGEQGFTDVHSDLYAAVGSA